MLAVCIGLASTMAPAVPAFAQQSTEFARTDAEWAALRDNNLNYEEIADLIHEYNNTVLQNAITYKNDYAGKTSRELANEYYDAAEDVYNRMSYPDADSSNYASALSSYLNSQNNYENLLKQGDNSTDDYETIRLQYDKVEKNLVYSAQKQMISYWSSYYSLDSLRNNVTTAQTNLESAKLKAAAGTGTQASLLQAEQSYSSAVSSLQSAESSLNNSREDLLIMLGWAHGDEVNIGAVPEVTAEMISSIDVNADIEKAKANSIDLQITNKQLTNARSDSVKEELTQTKANSEREIGSTVTSSYQSLLLAQSNLAQAEEALALQSSLLQTAQRKLQAGTITQNSYNQTATAYQNAATTVTTRKLSLLSAYVDYYWVVNGLA